MESLKTAKPQDIGVMGNESRQEWKGAISWLETVDTLDFIDGLLGGHHMELILSACAMYLTTIYVLNKWMASRKPFNLRTPLFLWSASLAVFSILGTIRMSPEVFEVYQKDRLYGLFCSVSYKWHPVAGVWLRLFVLSKIIEYGDTLFVQLRKQKLIFLHWFHHSLVSIFSFHCYLEFSGSSRMWAWMNYVVHSIMYTYYAMRALRYRPPRVVNISVTAVQIIQFVIGLAACIIIAWDRFINGSYGCTISDENALFALVTYCSFLVIFSHYFYRTYISPLPSCPADANNNEKLLANRSGTTPIKTG